jgi:hypothetical protein
MRRIGNEFVKNLHYLCLTGVIALGLLTIVATGGGGGGGGGGGAPPPITYTGITDPAAVDENNAVDLAVGAYEGGRTGAATGLMAFQTEGSGNVGYSRILKVSQVLEDSLRQLDFMSRSDGSFIGAIYTYTGAIYGDCGGSASYTISVNDQTGDFSGSLSFSGYCEDGVTIAGAASFSGQVNVITEDLLKFSLSFSALTGTSGIDSFTISGNISCDFIVYPYTMVISMLVRDNSTGKVYWVRDYTMTATEGSAYVDIELSGMYYDPDYGYVILTTTTPFRIYYAHCWPSEGVLVVAGDTGISGGSMKARLTALSSTTYQVEADTDGDGSYDWNSGVLNWFALYVDDDDQTCGGRSPCYATVQDAVDAACSGDTILVLPGVYVENVRIEGKDVALMSESGTSVTVLDGGSEASVIHIGEGANVIVEGFTIQNAGGAGTFVENGYGIVFCPFSEARATIRNNVLTQNPVRGGIGIINGENVEVEIQRNWVIDNFRGIEVQLGMDPAITGFVRIVNNAVAFNRVDPGEPSGAGIFLIACCAFEEPGDFILDVVNNTIYGNEGVYGGGLAANASNLTLLNNIFFANTASTEGPDLYLVQAALDASVTFNIIGDGQFDGIDGNSAVDPVFVNPEGGDFNLQPGSPAIDAGSNEEAPNMDLVGNPRPIDGDQDGIAQVDIGALEAL